MIWDNAAYLQRFFFVVISGGRRSFGLYFCFCFFHWNCAFSIFSHREKQKDQSSAMASLSSSNTAFALELYHTLGQTNTGNIFISPFSISSALAMVYLGAKRDTAAQMAKALSFNFTKDIHTDFQTLNADINSPSATYILKLANRLYGEKTCNFLTVSFTINYTIYASNSPFICVLFHFASV
ncbi:unnamed protein product [Oncorhynchus mykiss]|uniref:Serpin domain-containing protein n=1 Tax=Oncorhynchus mykiss TaxID=8022 RepID=A0A060YNU5_ONCMY|nr:unnamed protein product [Oncorhynchus mykiss]